MSKQASQRRPASDDAPMMTKAERRAAGKLAAQKRAAARRRKQILKNASAALAGIAVVAVLVVVFGGFGADDDPAAAPQASASAPATEPGAAPITAVPDNVDPTLKTKPQVTKGEGDLAELKVTTVVAGTGPAVQVGQTITVNYVGVTYADGKQFDSSWDRGQPLSFQLAPGALIEGWVEGLTGVTVGSRVQLDIPAEQAYGEDPGDGSPAGALRFVVDVLAAS